MVVSAPVRWRGPGFPGITSMLGTHIPAAASPQPVAAPEAGAKVEHKRCNKMGGQDLIQMGTWECAGSARCSFPAPGFAVLPSVCAVRMSAELVLMENRSKHSLIASSASPRPLCSKQLPLLSHLVGKFSGTLQGGDGFPSSLSMLSFPLLLVQLFLPVSRSPLSLVALSLSLAPLGEPSVCLETPPLPR